MIWNEAWFLNCTLFTKVRSLILHGGFQLLSAWCPSYNGFQWRPRGPFYQTFNNMPAVRFEPCDCFLSLFILCVTLINPYMTVVATNVATTCSQTTFAKGQKCIETSTETSAAYSTSPALIGIFSICSTFIALPINREICYVRQSFIAMRRQ